MPWLPAAEHDGAAAPATALDAVFGHRPELYRDYRDFIALFWERELVDPVLLELCRLRIAALVGCEAELGLRYEVAQRAGLTESKIAALDRWHEDDRFSERERAVLSFAELFVRDPHAITDDDAAAVVRELGDAGMVAFVETLALLDGFARFRVMLGVEPASDVPHLASPPRVGGASSY